MDHGRCADVCRDRPVRLRHGRGNGHVPLGNGSPQRGFRRCRIRWRRIQCSVWTGRRRCSRHGRQRVHVGLHDVDVNGPDGDGQRGVLDSIPERHEFDLGECRHNGRQCPCTWDDERNHHHSHAGHRATDRRRIYDCLCSRRGSLPARCIDHVKAGWADPGLSPGARQDLGGTSLDHVGTHRGGVGTHHLDPIVAAARAALQAKVSMTCTATR
jgi:hypothetical protein